MLLMHVCIFFFKTLRMNNKEGTEAIDFVNLCLEWRKKLSPVMDILEDEANNGELAAFISYALAFPSRFCVLVDTYDVQRWDITFLMMIPKVYISLEI